MKLMYQMSKTEVRQALNGGQEPLNEKQVLEKQEKYGFNELVEGKQKKIWQIDPENCIPPKPGRQDRKTGPQTGGYAYFEKLLT